MLSLVYFQVLTVGAVQMIVSWVILHRMIRLLRRFGERAYSIVLYGLKTHETVICYIRVLYYSVGQTHTKDEMRVVPEETLENSRCKPKTKNLSIAALIEIEVSEL